MTLWQRTTQRFMGQEAAPVIVPAKDDRRFKSAWDENTCSTSSSSPIC